MIAADTSALSAFLKNQDSNTTKKLDEALSAGILVLPPVVITEVMSDPLAGPALTESLPEVALLEILDGYWQRAGETRRLLKSKGLKAKVADALIAQCCIDHNVPLITTDADFRHFAKHCGLKLA